MGSDGSKLLSPAQQIQLTGPEGPWLRELDKYFTILVRGLSTGFHIDSCERIKTEQHNQQVDLVRDHFCESTCL